jgi:hypothetical protein
VAIIYDEEASTYFRSGHFGIHALMDFQKRGAGYFHYRHISRKIEEMERPAFSVGRATHTLVLEGEQVYDEEVRVKPEAYTNDKGERKKWNGNANQCKAWEKKARDDGATVISQSDDRCIRAMAHAVRNSTDAMRYLGRGGPETVIRSTEAGLPLQCRADWITGNQMDPWQWEAIVDLKTCDHLHGFEGDIFRYHYDRQAAFYQWMVQQETGATLPFVMVAVEKAPPHSVGVYFLDDAVYERAHRRNEWLIEEVAKHVEANEWPANPPAPITVGLPHWLQNEEGAA